MWRAVTPLCRVHFSNPCSANHNCLSAWYERELVLLHPGQLKWGSETISFCCLLCGKRKQHWCEKIFLRNFILHFREPLCFKTWLLLQVKERTKCPTVYQVYLKKPHFHQQFVYMYMFQYLLRFAFFYTERIWKRIVNNSVIQWQFHNTIFFSA